MNSVGRRRTSRSCRPKVEGLEALRLLSGGSVLPMIGPIIPDGSGTTVADPTGPVVGSDAWDAALSRSMVADLIAGSATTVDPKAITAGLSQLDRYLGRAWSRAGVPVQGQDDATQAVYASLLQTFGRPRFDALLTDIGTNGIRDVLSRETAEGPDFFRAIDTVKKRAQRERVHQPIDTVDVAAGGIGQDQAEREGALREAIDRSLNPREANLIRATLQGETPAEIAQKWGVAPKTVSNEKSRALQKLRDALAPTAGD